MPGQVLDIKAKVGDTIKKGDTIIVLSAMKVCAIFIRLIYVYCNIQMETVVKSAVDGKVKEIHVQIGQQVQGDDLVVELEQIVRI